MFKTRLKRTVYQHSRGAGNHKICSLLIVKWNIDISSLERGFSEIFSLVKKITMNKIIKK